MPGEKCNGIEVSAETSETLDSEHCVEVKGPYNLADIISEENMSHCTKLIYFWKKLPLVLNCRHNKYSL